MPRCVAFKCNNSGGYRFPKDPMLKKKWEQAIQKKNFKSTESSRLCSKHFLDSDFIQERINYLGLPQQKRQLIKTAVPSVFNSKQTVDGKQRYVSCMVMKDLFEENVQVDARVNSIPEVTVKIEPIDDLTEDVKPDLHPKTISTQTPIMFRLLSSGDLISDPESVLFYTGLEDIDKFELVLSTLLPMANHLHYRGNKIENVSIEDQFLIMLIKLRRNQDNFEIGKLFNISSTVAENVFVMWVNFVYELWSKLDIWPSRELINYYMPKEFKQNYSATRVIIDCMDIPIVKPTDPTAQEATFNINMQCNTMRFLVASTPGGLLSFCSGGYAGSISENEILERSSLLKICEENDTIMADRRFKVPELYLRRKITLNAPESFEELHLPSVYFIGDRIHLKRLMSMTNTFKFFNTYVDSFYLPLLSKVFFICAMLMNFKEM